MTKASRDSKPSKESKEKPVQFISKLVQLTQDGKLAWESASSRKDESETPFTVNIDGQTLRIYKYSRVARNPAHQFWESTRGMLVVKPRTWGSILGGDDDREPSETIVESGTVLQLEDDRGRALYKFEGTTGLSDLYESAAYSASKVGDLMDAVLAKK